MADSYGGISLFMSQESKIDHSQLIKKLNSYIWTRSGGMWSLNEGDKPYISFESSIVQYPTMFPDKIISLYVEYASGDESSIPFDGWDLENVDYAEPEETEITTLEELAKDISQAIDQGWIEIACSANQGRHYNYFQSLKIMSDGESTRKYILSGNNGIDDPFETIEIYNPSKVNKNNY